MCPLTHVGPAAPGVAETGPRPRCRFSPPARTPRWRGRRSGEFSPATRLYLARVRTRPRRSSRALVIVPALHRAQRNRSSALRHPYRPPGGLHDQLDLFGHGLLPAQTRANLGAAPSLPPCACWPAAGRCPTVPSDVAVDSDMRYRGGRPRYRDSTRRRCTHREGSGRDEDDHTRVRARVVATALATAGVAAVIR